MAAKCSVVPGFAMSRKTVLKLSKHRDYKLLMMQINSNQQREFQQPLDRL